MPRGRKPRVRVDALETALSEIIQTTGTSQPVKRVVKSGKRPSWKPASRLGELSVPEGYNGRWCSNDEANIQKKLAEGWVFVNKTNFPQTEHKESGNADVVDSVGVQGGVTYREMVGMMLPAELVEARTEYYKERNRKQLMAKIKMKDAVAENAVLMEKAHMDATITID